MPGRTRRRRSSGTQAPRPALSMRRGSRRSCSETSLRLQACPRGMSAPRPSSAPRNLSKRGLSFTWGAIRRPRKPCEDFNYKKALSGDPWTGSCTKNAQLPGCSYWTTARPNLVLPGQPVRKGNAGRPPNRSVDAIPTEEARARSRRIHRPRARRRTRGTACAGARAAASPARRLDDVGRSLRLLGVRPLAFGRGAPTGLRGTRRARGCAL